MIREIIREFLLHEVRGSISNEEMIRVVEKLPSFLRSIHPDVGYEVTRGTKKLLPFTLVKSYTNKPEIFSDGDSVSFSIHLGDGYANLLPTADQIKAVNLTISDFFRKRQWYLHSSRISGYGGDLSIEVMPEKTDIVHPENVLYHLTDKKNLSSIMKKGLVPKISKTPNERMYGPRVYLFTSRQELDEQIDQNKEAHLSSGYSWYPKLTETSDVVVLVIDTKKLRKGTKLQRDPEFGGSTGAVFTKSHVPPESIIDVESVSS
jgi:RNA:NAD 2'-phosphotransferase (TPT1/KptA family)